jgi:hypothetical protein
MQAFLHTFLNCKEISVPNICPKQFLSQSMAYVDIFNLKCIDLSCLQIKLTVCMLNFHIKTFVFDSSLKENPCHMTSLFLNYFIPKIVIRTKLNVLYGTLMAILR